MAIGNPFQLGHTVTVGVVSYQGRPFQLEEGRWQQMIQTDASINPGNSGGPLINVRGEVVGINTAILGGAGNAGNIGIGFAVPINSVRALLPQLRQGHVVRGRIGVQLRGGPITEDEAKALGLPKASGAIVVAVERDSPAARTGVQAGDVITAFDDTAIASADELIPRVSSTAPGTTMMITVVRNGQTRALSVTVEALSPPEELPAGVAPAPAFGLTFDDVTPNIARHMRLPVGLDGALVSAVSAGSPGDDAGVHAGDIVREINRHAVHKAADARQTLAEIEPGGAVFLLVWRQGNELFLQIRPD
jgi:serine protease Do